MARVLIVDDSKTVLATALAVLQDHEVQTLDNPLLVPSVIRSYKPDWLVMDYHMPILNGEEAIKSIINAGLMPADRIILFSSDKLGDALVKKYGLAANADKNFDLLQILIR